MPLLEARVNGLPAPSGRLAPILESGLLVGLVLRIILLSCLLLLAPLNGGVYEELLTRLFLLTLIAWIANRSWQKPTPQLSNAAFWFANILAAIAFGLGHLPSSSLFMPITAIVVVAALLLKGIAGIAFGYLYRSRFGGGNDCPFHSRFRYLRPRRRVCKAVKAHCKNAVAFVLKVNYATKPRLAFVC